MTSRENIGSNIGKITVILLSLTHVAQCKEATLRWFKNSTSDYVEYTLDNATAVLNTDYYNTKQNIIIFTSGFSQRADSEAVISVVRKYINRDDRLAVQLQWDDQANSNLNSFLDLFNISSIFINYPIVVYTTKGVGEALGQALFSLYKAGVDLNKIHLVGHSLGAHVMGIAGRTLKNCTGGRSVNRITGLDPASYGYQEPLLFIDPIGSDCADFVDIVHTDPARFGNKKNLGHCDFWVNDAYYKNHGYQPGCQNSNFAFCSHVLAVTLWKEAIDNPLVLPASAAGSENSTVYIGDYTDRTARGSYYLCTNDEAPYSKGEAGTDPTQCLS